MKRFLSFFLIATLLFLIPGTSALADDWAFALDAEASLVINLETGREVYRKNADKIMYPASLTKILTTLIALEECEDPKNTVVTIPDTAIFKDVYDEGGMTIYLQKGEKLTLWDLLCATMLKSACDSATAVAWYVGGGDTAAFYEKMNTRAKELGAVNSNFVNAHGLHNGNHYSTAQDIMCILRAALNVPLFDEIISLQSYTIPKTNLNAARTFDYTVSLVLEKSDSYYPEAKGVKTGFTDAAGRCLTTTVCRDGTTYAIVLLGANLKDPVSAQQPVNYAFTDTITIAEHLFSHYARETFVQTNEILTELALSDNRDYRLTLMADKDVEVLLCSEDEISCTYSLPESIALGDISAGKAVGSATVLINGEAITTFSLYPAGYVPFADASLPTLSLENKPLADKEISSDLEDNDDPTPIDTTTLILCVALFLLVLTALILLAASRLKPKTRKPTRYKKS